MLHRMSAARERTIRLSFGGVGVALGVAVSHFAPLLVALVVAGIGVALVLLQAAIWMNYLKESKSIIKKIDDGIKIIEPRERGTKLPESEPA